jgi:hypothetical protein
MTRYLLTLTVTVLLCGVPFLTRGWVCILYTMLVLASVVFLGSESLGTRDNILISQIGTSLFFASYDSQGHGGGIRPRLHTGEVIAAAPRYIDSARTAQRTPLPRVFLRTCHLRPLPNNGRCLQSHYLGAAVVIQLVSWSLPNSGSTCHNFPLFVNPFLCVHIFYEHTPAEDDGVVITL